jgi:hypothetical protein
MSGVRSLGGHPSAVPIRRSTASHGSNSSSSSNTLLVVALTMLATCVSLYDLLLLGLAVH